MDTPGDASPAGNGNAFPWRRTDPRQARVGRRLRWSMVVGLLIVSALPFVVIGGGAWLVFRNLAIQETRTLYRNVSRAHAAAVDAYLSEQLRTVELIARTHSLGELGNARTLRQVFETISEVQGNSFVDLGVISQSGRHLAYVGPYDLMGREYGEEDWFRTVMSDGVAVSDVFMGFRQSPHSIIAVRQSSAEGYWILRATLDNRSLYALVRSLAVGRSGDVFIVNRDGVYQTPPRSGDVLTQSGVTPSASQEVREERVETPSGAVRQVSTWLSDGQWLLVVRQPESEILAPVARAVGNGALIALFALLLIFIATLFVTSRLIRQIDTANRERDLMYADLLRSAKLASLGEMATGLAHEINNPLAVMSAEHTNLADELAALDLPKPAHAALDRSVQRLRRQVARCGDVTGKMLQFGRDSGTTLAATEVGPVFTEVGGLLERRAQAAGAVIEVDVEPELPRAWLDANELEQVLLNLVNNSLDAVTEGGSVHLSATQEAGEILLRVTDDGSGIPPENLDRIFQPFFTTKPVGQGTGLGLAVVYGIVGGWGTSIDIQSEPGAGTTVTIRVPVASEPPIASGGGGEGAPGIFGVESPQEVGVR
ncbi:MAG: ATP-binding protein [Gemmatimonadetes bacterium]|nr:ATP-binding protein [Gemmatimonadota bacterium]